MLPRFCSLERTGAATIPGILSSCVAKNDTNSYAPCRIRISSCGVVDVLMYDSRQDIIVLQQENLAMFGRLVFDLCCNNLAAVNSPNALETLGRQYWGDMKNVALFLISKPGPHKVRDFRRRPLWISISFVNLYLYRTSVNCLI
jgi:hypothetical protein